MMTEDMQGTAGPALETVKAIAAELGIDLAADEATGDVAACEARLDDVARVLEVWADKRESAEQDPEAIEWTVDYVLDAIMSLGHDDRSRLAGRYAEILKARWDSALLKIYPISSAHARLMTAALDGADLSDSQAKMLRFKLMRSKEGLGKRG
ncbi:MAG: hypothetical protein ACOYIP_01500 [Coriobacteriales bacterium]